MIVHIIPSIMWTTVTQGVWGHCLGKYVEYKLIWCNVSHNYTYDMNDNDTADQLRPVYQITRFHHNMKWWWALWQWGIGILDVNYY